MNNILELSCRKIINYFNNASYSTVKKKEYLEIINNLDINCISSPEINILLETFSKIHVNYKDKDRSLFYDIIRKIIVTHHNDNNVSIYATNNFLILFSAEILRNEDYMFFKQAFLEKRKDSSPPKGFT
jgi:hypothetical protein